ncbi:hypothetical protein F5I97DRAFT_1617038 [Phlebopus sp. FC_14]|nr:hypothetical protein F5I97DRAFT_1617038 [Phlebopus sp. FC_14]
MPRSLRTVLAPPPALGESATRPRSVLFDPMMPQSPPSVPSSAWPSTSCHQPGTGLFRARQSVSSIGSCSTVQTRTIPVKSILTRHDSGISMVTTRRKRKHSPPSVKFVDAPTVHYDHGVYRNTSPPCSPSASAARRRMKGSRWLTMWWKRSPGPPPRPTISGPYHLSYSASLVDVYGSRSPKPVPGRLKRFWIRVTKAFGQH